MLFTIIVAGSVLGMVRCLPAVDYYTTKYEHIDVDAILNNRRLVNYYAACMLSKGPCPPEGLEFKHILPEALQTNCARCTEKQKAVTLRSVKRLKKEYPKVWKQLEAIWDPDRIYVDKFISTFDRKVSTGSTPGPIVIFNRFGEVTETNEVDRPESNLTPVTYLPPAESGNTLSFASRPTSTTTSRPVSTTITTPRTTSTISTTTNPTTTTTNTINTQPTNKPRPTAGVATNLQATVSLGTNLVGGFVRGLGNLGVKVIGTGVQISEMVLRGIQSVVSPRRQT